MVEPTPEQREAAQSYVRANTSLNTGPLTQALNEVYGDSYALGLLSGAEQAGQTVVAGLGNYAVPADWSAFWASWEPGNLNAALSLTDGGFQTLLDNAAVTIQGVADTTLDQIGSILAEGALNGDSVDTVARSINEFLDDPGRAFTIANTELNRAVTLGSIDQFQAADIAEWDLIASPDACPECVAIEAANPHSVGDMDDLPPVHPNCRCAASPHA